MMSAEMAGLIEQLRHAAPEWDTPDAIDADLRGAGGWITAVADEFDAIAEAVEQTGVHPAYAEVMRESAAEMRTAADELQEVCGGGVMHGPAAGGSIAAITGQLAAATPRMTVRPDPPKSNVAAPWVPGPPPLPGGLRRPWQRAAAPEPKPAPPRRPLMAPETAGVLATVLGQPAGYVPPGYELRQPATPRDARKARREARKRMRDKWR